MFRRNNAALPPAVQQAITIYYREAGFRRSFWPHPSITVLLNLLTFSQESILAAYSEPSVILDRTKAHWKVFMAVLLWLANGVETGVTALSILHDAGLLSQNNIRSFIAHANPRTLADVLLTLHHARLLTDTIRDALRTHVDPRDMSRVLKTHCATMLTFTQTVDWSSIQSIADFKKFPFNLELDFNTVTLLVELCQINLPIFQGTTEIKRDILLAMLLINHLDRNATSEGILVPQPREAVRILETAAQKAKQLSEPALEATIRGLIFDINMVHGIPQARSNLVDFLEPDAKERWKQAFFPGPSACRTIKDHTSIHPYHPWAGLVKIYKN